MLHICQCQLYEYNSNMYYLAGCVSRTSVNTCADRMGYLHLLTAPYNSLALCWLCVQRLSQRLNMWISNQTHPNDMGK